MPRVEFTLWDRVYLLKLICTEQMTYSSFITMLYIYLIILQSWNSLEGEKSDILKHKCIVIGVTILDFGLGTLLAFGANMRGIRCRRRIVTWIILETILIPISIFFIMQLYIKITTSPQQLVTDPHYSRVNITQMCFLLFNYFFIGYALDFLGTHKEKTKTYDPSIRPESVYAPTDPQITTTESRHIRMSQSFLCQSTNIKRVSKMTLEEVKPGTSKDEENDFDEI